MIERPVFGFFHRPREPTPASEPSSQAETAPLVERPAATVHSGLPRASAPAIPEPPQVEVSPASAAEVAAPDIEPLPASVPYPPAIPHHAPDAMQTPADAVPALRQDACDTAAPAGHTVKADQLGLAHPDALTLRAQLPGAAIMHLDASISGLYRPKDFHAALTGYGVDRAVDPVIGLAAGTRILTARGEVEVERLQPGDAAMTLRGPALLAIEWIGRNKPVEAPIRIQAGAFGADRPRRDLCVASGQPIFLEATPVIARTLVNGSTIRALKGNSVDMFQVDVGASEILFAEGLPLSSGVRATERATP